MLNQVHQGNCLDLISSLEDNSIRAVITSPPYAEKRKKQYGGISEDEYPGWITSVMEALRPKLTDDGNVLIVIRSHIQDGHVSDYVLQSRLAIRKSGWTECEELIWYKPNSPPMGSFNRPRRAWDLQEAGLAVAGVTIWITKAGQLFLKRYPTGADRFDLIRESESFAKYMERIELTRKNGRYDQRILDAIQDRREKPRRSATVKPVQVVPPPQYHSYRTNQVFRRIDRALGII